MTTSTYPWLTVALKIFRRALPARLRERLRQWMFEWLDLRWKTRSLVHLHVATFEDWILYNEIFVNGEYDHAIALAVDAARDDGSPLQVVDLGANVGYFTLRAVDHVLGRGGAVESLTITAVEPNLAHAREYEARVLHANGLAARARVVRGVVGERHGTAAFDGGRIVAAHDGARAFVSYVDLSSCWRRRRRSISSSAISRAPSRW
jgi:hypothetical protein